VITAQPGEAVKTTVVEKHHEGYRIEPVALETEPGFTLDALVAVQEQAGLRSKR